MPGVAGLPGHKGDKGEKVKYQLKSLFQVFIFGLSFLYRNCGFCYSLKEYPCAQVKFCISQSLILHMVFLLGSLQLVSLWSPLIDSMEHSIPAWEAHVYPNLLASPVVFSPYQTEKLCMSSVVRIFPYYVWMLLLLDRILCSGFILAVINRI